MGKKRIEYLPVIQVICACAVCFLHTNTAFWSYSNKPWWITANFIECLFYFAVPVFYMISGATLIGFLERYSIKDYLKKRVSKAVIPFLGWSLIGLVYQIVLGRIDISNLGLLSIVSGILSTSYVQIFWFFIPLFCLYISIPVFSAVDKKHQKTVFTYILIAGFTINVAIPFLFSCLRINLSWPFVIDVINGSMLYAITGYMLVQYPLKRTGRIILYVCSLLGFFIHAVGTHILSAAAGEVVSTYKGYYSFACYLYSIGIFVFLQNVGTTIMQRKIGVVFRFLSQYTFPIYLMHYFIIDLMNICFSPNAISLVYRLGAPFVIIPIIIGITWLLRKIPYMKYFVP